MSGNAAFLSGLKKTTETREKQFQSKIWGTIFVIGSVVATYFADDFSTRTMILGVAVLAISALFVGSQQSKSDVQSLSNGSVRPNALISVVPANSAAAPGVAKRESSGTATAGAIRNRILSPTKASRDFGKHQDRQSADWGENFDVQSPQRIAHAAMTEAQQQESDAAAVGPSGTGLLPTSILYPNANTNYGGKTNVANLGYQFAGNTLPSTASFASPSGTSTRATGRTYQTEQPAPTWHDYHSSPISEAPVLRAASPVGLQRGSSGGLYGDEDEGDDPLDEIVNRVNAGRGTGTVKGIENPFSDRKLSVNTAAANNATSTGFASVFSPSRAGGRSFTTPSSARGRSSAGLTEDRLEHVLTKYLESQEQIVWELSQELLRLLTQRASSGPAGTVPFLHNQDDLSKVRKILELQADRQIMSNRSLLGLTELVRYCRSIGVHEELLRQYEAAVAVLQSPNHSSYSNPSTPHASSSQPHSQAYSHPHSSAHHMGSSSSSMAASNANMYSSYGTIPEPASSSGAFTSTRRSRF